MPNLTGQSLGRYHILEQLGEGGMAIVYKAYDTRLEREVAVKVIRMGRLAPDLADKTRKRFDREAKALARLNHANIVQVIDFGEHEGVPYLVMPYLPGGTLKQRIGHGRIAWVEAINLLAPIAHALDYAHRQNIIHRDIKPSNVLIGESGTPMLSDFGVAKVLSDSDETHELTGTGMGVGTPEYMAPEQFRGQGDERTDIYALGVVLYEMVAGRKPYIAETPADVIIKQAMDPLPRPSRFAPDLPASIENILIKSLAKAPKDRYQRMGEFAQALERLILAGEKEKQKQESQKKKAELQQKNREEKARKKQEAKKKKEELQQQKREIFNGKKHEEEKKKVKLELQRQEENRKIKEPQKEKQGKIKQLQREGHQKAKPQKPVELSKKKWRSSVPLKPVLWGIFGIVCLGILYGVINGVGFLHTTQQSSAPIFPPPSLPAITTSTSFPAASPTPQYTSTPIMTPTQIMTPTPSPTAMPDGWLYFDDFEGAERRHIVLDIRNNVSNTKYGIDQYEENHVYYINTGAHHMTMEFSDLINMAKDGVIFSNYAFEFDMMFPEQLPRYSNFNVHLRSSQRGDRNASTSYICGVQFFNFKQIGISYRSPFTSENISDRLPKSFQSNTWYRHRFEVKGKKIKWFINGALQLQTEDSRISTGLPLINIGGHSPDNEGNGGLFYFDNILVESLD